MLHQQEDTHRRLTTLIEGAPEEQFAYETRFRRRLRLDTYGHYPHHEKMIRSFRLAQSTHSGTTLN